MKKIIYVLPIIILCILSIGIVLLIPTEDQELERNGDSKNIIIEEEEDNMVTFELYSFVELRQMQNSKKPFNTHLIWEHATYGLFFVDSTDQTVLLKTTDEGVTVSTVDISDNTNSYKIQAGWLEGNDLWLVMCDNDGTADDFEVCYIEMDDSDDCNPIAVSAGADANSVYVYDIFMLGADVYVLSEELKAAVKGMVVWDVDTNPFVEKDRFNGLFEELGLVVVVGTVGYFLYETIATNLLWFWSFNDIAGSFSALAYEGGGPDSRPEDYTFPPLNQKAVAYDGNNIFYFILKKDGDSKKYLWAYSLSGEIFTVGAEYNIALMLDRNCVGTSGTPWEFEKAFHVTSSYVYQIARGMDHLFKLQDIELTGGEVIIAISDKYLITDNSDLYEYTEHAVEFAKAEATYKTHALPSGIFEHTDQLSTDQLIEIYDFDDPTYELAFRGKAGRPTYRVRKGKVTYRFKPKNLGFDDLKQKVSYTATTAGIDEVVIALLGQLTNPYVYGDATSIPDTALTMTYTFTDVYLRDALYICSILANGYWWVEPNGYLYFRKWPGLISEWYYGEPDNFNKEVIGTSGTSIGFVDTATLHDGALEIVNEWQDHKRVLRLLDDATAGEDPTFTHNITAAMDGTVEFWVGSNNTGPTDPQWYTFGLYDSDATEYVVLLRIENDDLDYLDDGDAWQEIQTVADDTLYHIKITWVNAGTDTFSVWVDDVLKVNGGNCNNNQTAGVDGFIVTGLSDSVDYLYIDAWGNIANSHYAVGYNKGDALTQTSARIGPPRSLITQIQYNDFSNVRGGWNSATNAPYTPTTPTIAAHVQQYGRLLWDGRKIFSGAITQASLDAIVAGLKAWQGMVSNPVDMEMNVLGQYYSNNKIGYYYNTQYSGRTEFATATDRINVKSIIDFKRPGKIKSTYSDNLVRKR